MFNNSHYKVMIESEKPESIRFVHPVQPGQQVDNGWLKRPAEEETVKSGMEFATESTFGLRLIPEEEVARHNKKDDCWIIVDGRVYDFTAFLPDHPGGDWAIACWAGRNASKVFHDVHHTDINKQKEMFCIGAVEPPKLPKVLKASAAEETALQVFKWVTAKIEKKKELSHDVRLSLQLLARQGEQGGSTHWPACAHRRHACAPPLRGSAVHSGTSHPQ